MNALNKSGAVCSYYFCKGGRVASHRGPGEWINCPDCKGLGKIFSAGDSLTADEVRPLLNAGRDIEYFNVPAQRWTPIFAWPHEIRNISDWKFRLAPSDKPTVESVEEMIRKAWNAQNRTVPRRLCRIEWEFAFGKGRRDCIADSVIRDADAFREAYIAGLLDSPSLTPAALEELRRK